MNPEKIRSAVSRAGDFIHAGKLAQAEKLLTACVRLAPDSPEALHLLGECLLFRNKPSEAEPILRRAVKIKGDKASTFLHLGQALNALGRRKAAAAALRKALALTKRR